MALRAKVLNCFKNLHRARKEVFEGDTKALSAARLKIREEFVKYKDINDQQKINELIELGHQVAKVLRTSVIQAKLTSAGNYQIRITKNTELNESPGVTAKKKDDF